jgi:chromosome segregation ATPase
MRVRFWFKALLIVPALCIIGLPASAQQGSPQQQSGDPVADAARKAREDKKNATKPKKVFTDDDVKSAASSGQDKPGGTAAGDQKTGDAGKTPDSNSEAAWRKRFREQRDKIAKAEMELDVLQRESDKAQIQYYGDPQKAMQEQNSRKEINDKKAKIDAKQAELVQLKAGLDDLEDQLRKAGGDPGWAR